jgi:glycosyltransferase involved in cell wall biosynthesis
VILFPSPGEYRGGSVHSSFLLFEELVRRGHDARLAFHGTGYARDLARERGLPFMDVPTAGAPLEVAARDRFRFRDLMAAPLGRRLILRNNVTLVHVNDRRMLRTWAIPAKATGRVLLAHWRSVYGPSWSVDIGLKLASGIVCVSEYSRDLLPPWARAKSDVVYNPFRAGVERDKVAEVRQRIRAEAGIPANAAVVGFFGALLKRKRPHVLLQILQRLQATNDGRPVLGVVCGEAVDPRDDTYFQMIATGDWKARLIAAGHVTNSEEWMAACDVMVAPAVDEPLARVGVEAQGIGLPALVSSDGGLREVVEHGVSGLIVDPHDIDAWVNSVADVLNNPDLARRLSEGGLRAASRLTVDKHVDAIEAIYERILPSLSRAVR